MVEVGIMTASLASFRDSSTDAPPSSRVLLALLAVYVLWGSTYYGIAIAVHTLPPILMAGMRFVVAGGVLYGALRLRGAPVPRPAEWRNALISGALLFGGGNGFVVLAERTMPSGLTSIVIASTPIVAVIVSLAWGERPRPLEWLGVMIGIVAVGWLCSEGSIAGMLRISPILLLAPISWTLGSFASRSLKVASGPMGAATQMLAGGAVMIPLGFAIGEHLPAAFEWRGALAWIYLVVFGSLVGFTAYAYLLRNTRPALAMSYAYVNPVVAVILGTALGGERLPLRALTAGAAVLGSVCLISVGGKK
jgi:drug/metabolite transporter (DMT)-like permease